MDIWRPQDWIIFRTYLALPISLPWCEASLAPALRCSWRCWKPAVPAVPRGTAPQERADPVPLGASTGNRTLNQLRQASCLSPSPTQTPSLPVCLTNLTRQLILFLQVKAKWDQDLFPAACFNTGHLGGNPRGLWGNPQSTGACWPCASSKLGTTQHEPRQISAGVLPSHWAVAWGLVQSRATSVKQLSVSKEVSEPGAVFHYHAQCKFMAQTGSISFN